MAWASLFALKSVFSFLVLLSPSLDKAAKSKQTDENYKIEGEFALKSDTITELESLEQCNLVWKPTEK